MACTFQFMLRKKLRSDPFRSVCGERRLREVYGFGRKEVLLWELNNDTKPNEGVLDVNESYSGRSTDICSQSRSSFHPTGLPLFDVGDP